MSLTTARKKANAKYEAKAYDKTLIRLPKGRLDEIRAHIEHAGESLNGFIGRAILETMARDGGGTAPGAAPVEQVLAEMPAKRPQKAVESTPRGEVVSLSSETLKVAQRASEAAGETPAVFVARAIETQAQRDKASLKLGINPAAPTGQRMEE